MEFRILGPLEVLRGGASLAPIPRKQRALLALLLLNANRVVSTDRLVEELWRGRPPPGAAKTLRSHISHLRALVSDDVVQTRAPGYLLEIDPEQLDALRFERLVGEGREALGRGDAVRAAERLRAGLALWRGGALADVADEPFVEPEASRLEELRLEALEERLQADLERGRHAELVTELDSLLAEQPLRERLWAELMLALYRCDRQAEALEAYRRAREILAEELGLEPGPRLRELGQAILRHEVPPAPEPAEPPHNLLTELTTFVGRERELAEVRELLRPSRLLTLTGTGGAGKTRLAIETARQMLGETRDGVWVVDVAPVTNAMLVPNAVAVALGVEESRDAPVLDRLRDRLRNAGALIVLDNCEHLVEGCGSLAEQLCRASAQLRILATSRSPLGVPGEVTYPVLPLALPVDSSGDPEALLASGAVRLFIERMRAVRPGPALELDELRMVSRICSELDGLPLAIELAAARASSLTIADIEQHLADKLSFLKYWRRVAASRHPTLRAAFDWSYDLLRSDERTFWRRLAVFSGGFTVESAAAVCTAGDDAASLDAVGRLVDASLVLADVQAGRSRYYLLETVRQYAAGRLAEAGDGEEAGRLHAEYFLAMSDRAWAAMEGPDEAAWLAVLEVEVANLRWALEWSLAADDGMAAGLARVLGTALRLYGRLDEGRACLERVAQQMSDDRTVLRADVLGTLGALMTRQSDFDYAQAALEEAVAIARDVGSRSSEGRWLHFLAFAWRCQAEFERARALLAEAVDAKREAGDPGAAAWSVGSLADHATLQGDFDEATRLYEEGLRLVADAGDPPTLTVAYSESMALLARLKGDVERTVSLAERGLADAREVGDAYHVGLNLWHLAWVARERGLALRAVDLAHRSLASLRGIRQGGRVAEVFELLAGLELDEDRPLQAASLLGAASALRERSGEPLPPALRPALEREVAAAKGALGESGFSSAFTAGTELRPDEAMEFVRAIE